MRPTLEIQPTLPDEDHSEVGLLGWVLGDATASFRGVSMEKKSQLQYPYVYYHLKCRMKAKVSKITITGETV